MSKDISRIIWNGVKLVELFLLCIYTTVSALPEGMWVDPAVQLTAKQVAHTAKISESISGKEQELLAQAQNQLPAGMSQREPAIQPTSAASRSISINFNNVGMAEYVHFVSRLTGRNFIYDENDLVFNVTIVSEQPVTLDEIMSALLQELRIHDLSVIEEGDNIIIHRNPAVKGLSNVVVDNYGSTEVIPPEADIVTQVIQLNTLDANAAQNVISSMMSARGMVEIFRDSNHMVISDFTANVKQMVEILKGVDAPASSLIIGQYVTRNTSLDTFVELIREVMKPIVKEQPFTLIPHSASNSIFIVTTPFIMERALPIMQRLDQRDGTTGVFDLKSINFMNYDSWKEGLHAGPQDHLGGGRVEGKEGHGGGEDRAGGALGGGAFGGIRGRWEIDKSGQWYFLPNLPEGTPGSASNPFVPVLRGTYASPGASPVPFHYTMRGQLAGESARLSGAALRSAGVAGVEGGQIPLEALSGQIPFGAQPGQILQPGQQPGTSGPLGVLPGTNEPSIISIPPGGAPGVLPGAGRPGEAIPGQPRGAGQQPIQFPPGGQFGAPGVSGGQTPGVIPGISALQPIDVPPPEGYWKADAQGNWFFQPGRRPEAPPGAGPEYAEEEQHEAQSGPKGDWVINEEGLWIFQLAPGESIFSAERARFGKLNPNLPVGFIERTKFFIYKLQFRRGDSVEEAIRRVGISLIDYEAVNAGLLATINSIQWLEESNSLIISGPPEDIEKVIELIHEIDIPLRQVFIEMLILDTSIDDSLNYGVNWGSRFGGGDVSGSQGFVAGATNLQQALNTTGIGTTNGVASRLIPNGLNFASAPGYTLGIIGQNIVHKAFGLEFSSIGALVHALHERNVANVVLSPKILTEDGVTAEVFVGINTQFRTQSVANDQGSVITSNFEFRDVGTRLTVTPTLGPSNIITLDISEEVSAVITNPNQTAGGGGGGGSSLLSDSGAGPSTRKNTTRTKVHVPDGFFLVMSGMIQEDDNKLRDQVPCLGGVPLLGSLFSFMRVVQGKRNLMIFIRPKLIDTEEEVNNITRHEQNVFKIKRKAVPMWKYEVEEAIEFANLEEWLDCGRWDVFGFEGEDEAKRSTENAFAPPPPVQTKVEGRGKGRGRCHSRRGRCSR